MDLQAVTVNLPGPLYERLARRAKQARRTVEAELVDAVMTALPDEPDGLPPDLAELIASLSLLEDQPLWRVARTRLPEEKAALLENLHVKRQAEGLSPSETETVTTLMKEYTRTMLMRAEAAALLKERGHDVSEFLRHEP